MQQFPFEIKSRLLKAVDKEYNVVDMGTVLEIVTILERTPITKEALETTRLGRDINELRRKTTNESLAKRAKDLVRRWRDLILPQSEGGGGIAVPTPQADTTIQNGAAPATPSAGVRRAPVTPAQSSTSGPGPGGGGSSGALRSNPISPAISLPASDKSSVVSPALSTSRLDAVPRTHASNKRLRKEGGSSKSTSPELPPNKKSKHEQSTPPVIKEVQEPPPAAPTTIARVNGDHYDSVGSDCEIVSVTPATPSSTPTKQKSRKKAPKDRTKKKKKDKGGGDIVKEKIASIARLHKVKTTQELLAGLQSKSGDNSVFPSEDVALNKSEHIVRFLRSQTENDEDTVVDVEGRSDQEDEGANAVGVKGKGQVLPSKSSSVKVEKDRDKALSRGCRSPPKWCSRLPRRSWPGCLRWTSTPSTGMTTSPILRMMPHAPKRLLSRKQTLTVCSMSTWKALMAISRSLSLEGRRCSANGIRSTPRCPTTPHSTYCLMWSLTESLVVQKKLIFLHPSPLQSLSTFHPLFNWSFAEFIPSN
uniref:Mediator of RNA polymerase II transcription subunit 26 n=1 Tax=Lygus hesperus TaxID=30085 RepID=A0A0A9WDF0_LYGHE